VTRLLEGPRALAGALGFVATDPVARRLALLPMILNLLLAIIVWWWGYHWIAAGAFLGGQTGWTAWARQILASAGVVAGCLVATLFIGICLTEPICGLLGIADRLVLRQKEALGVTAAWPPVSLVRALLRTVKVLAVGIVIQIPATLFSLAASVTSVIPFLGILSLPLGALGLLLAASVVAWNIFDYPFSLMGLGARRRLACFLAAPHLVLGLGLPLVCCSLLLYPLLLPVGILAATRLAIAMVPEPPAGELLPAPPGSPSPAE